MSVKPSYANTTIKVTCPKCRALPGNPCRDKDGRFYSTWMHSVRVPRKV